MKFLAFYTDPKKKNLQKIQLAFLALSTPFALIWGGKAAKEWSDFSKAEAYFQEGDAHFHEGRTTEAALCFEKAVKQYPQFYGAWEGLGTLQHMANHHDEELKIYQRAVVALPAKGELYRELSTAFHEAGDHKAERDQLIKAVALLGQGDLFTARLLDRAQREIAGTYPKVAERAQPTSLPASTVIPAPALVPAPALPKMP